MNPENIIHIQAECSSFVNCAMQQNHVPAVRRLVLQNLLETELRNLRVEIVSQPEFALPFRAAMESLPAGQSVSLEPVNLLLSAPYLVNMTERVSGTLTVRVQWDGGETAAEETIPVDVLAFDEWSGKAAAPEMLAAFVTPNDPAIAEIIRLASEILGKWTGNPSLDAYQSNDPDRARQQVAAVYAAVKSRNIAYCVPPASFETSGQRVRLCDALLSHKIGTCLDLALLFASCLEAVGLDPLVILMTNHAFVGAWLVDETFPESVQDDISLLTKRMAEGENRICAVETTLAVAGSAAGFEDAERHTARHFAEPERFLYFVDIARARASGIRPLPIRIATAEGFRIQEQPVAIPKTEQAPEHLETIADVPENGAPVPVTKKAVWERKLLDLSLRNNLLNFRPLRSSVHVLSVQLDQLEDALAGGDDFQVLEKPLDWVNSVRDGRLFESQTSLAPMKPLLAKEFAQKRLRSDLDAAALSVQMKGLYRKSRDAMEENGANVLYLALGFLKWYETPASQKPRFAPIVLLPVEIVRKCSRAGFVVRERDDEPQMNITLLEMLKQDFGIRISGLDPLPADEHGVDMRLVFHILRQAVMSQPRWDVCEDAYLGVFSFSRFVMWNDIRNRSEDLVKNKMVKSLMSGKLEFTQEPLLPPGKSTDELCRPDELILASDADASQVKAVYASAGGKNFVLHGPPGTGKSQTITNLIFNAMAQGKTVLFVAEKMAALSVVQKRLEKLGLGTFCLELHSNKATKKAVLDQLRAATEVVKDSPPEGFSAQADRLQKQRETLDAYSQALYRGQPFGLTLYDAVTRYFQFEQAPDAVEVEPSVFSTMTEEKLQQWTDAASELSAAAADAGSPHNHPLREIGLTDYSQEKREQARTLLAALKSDATECDSLAAQLLRLLGCEISFSSLQEYETLTKLTRTLPPEREIPRALLEADDVPAATARLEALCAHGRKEQELRKKLLSLFSDGILLYDGQVNLACWNQLETKWFLPKLLGQNRIVKALQALSNGSAVQKQEVPGILADIAAHAEEKKAVEAGMADAAPLAGACWKELDTDWQALLTACAFARQADGLILSLTHDRPQTLAARRNLSALLSSSPDLRPLRAYETAYSQTADGLPKLKNLLSACFGTAPEPGTFLAAAAENSGRWTAHLDGLREWCAWSRAREKALALGLASLVRAWENGAVTNETSLSAFRKGVYRACARYLMAREPALSSFSGSIFEEKIRQYRQTAETMRCLSREETFARLAARIPDFSQEAAQSSEVGILKRAIRSNGRGVSIRSLFGQIPHLLPRLCPCMLMSPISVAQYLDPQYRIFDLVVFDEASQVPTSEAVGAIARGENAVIVGDPKQLPPTSFFSTDTTDEENPDTEDLESILDDCLALSAPEMHLLWHYRSRHESLITFSNMEYYENKLYTFPSPNNLVSKVKLVPVEGFYDRGGTKQNAAEAHAVVDDILLRLKDPERAKHSIGVVTFNSAQQNLIDDLLMEAFAQHPELEEIEQKCHEPVFVKNLENVQGDERDVILFSIGYGPDKDGRVSHNFGPLNQAGGWRRLNVAVSRAREEMTVYSALKPEQLDLSRTRAEGVAGLKAFLEFAQKGQPALVYKAGQSKTTQQESLNAQIAARLTKAGLRVQTDVGASSYKIDLAVVDPGDPNRFLLGVLCNGPSYRDAQTAGDRELLQRKVLEQLGWNLHTIWIPDWWENPEKEVQKVKEAVEQLVSGTPRKDEKAQPLAAPAPRIASSAAAAPATRPASAPKDQDAQPYLTAELVQESLSSDEFCLSEHTCGILDKIALVINTEGPVSRSLLCRRVLQSYGIARMGSRLEKRFDELMETLHAPVTQSEGTSFYWPATLVPSSYRMFRVSENDAERRSAEDLPPEEVACAVCHILKNQLSMSRNDLVHETYKAFGYSRSGTAVEQAMQSGIHCAQNSGRISVDAADIVSLCE